MRKFWDDLEANEKWYKSVLKKRLLILFVYVILFVLFETFVITSGGDFFHGEYALNIFYTAFVDSMLFLGGMAEVLKIRKAFEVYTEEKERLWKEDFSKFKSMMALGKK